MVNAQTITGIVTGSDDGLPLPGVNIQVKGTDQGTISDVNGAYTINVSSQDAVLIFSFVGFIRQQQTVGSQTTINVVLEIDSKGLDEVVVIGYGTVKKKLNTGANLNIKGEQIEELTPSNAMEALQGISPGVNITKNNGQPGAGTKVYIRGIGTTGNSNPLYVVDGISVGNIDYLSPSDIASIDVLKDAASCAIYGSRAANGVILVTTKKGEKGSKPVISYDAYQGWQNVYKKPPLLNAQEYAFIMNEGRINDGLAPFDFASMIPSWDQIENGWEGTNWFDEITTKDAYISNHTLNVTGGSDRTIYSLGASYYDETGIIGGGLIDAGLKRLTLRMNTEFTLAEKNGFKAVVLGENLTYTNSERKGVADGNIYWNDLHDAIVQNPFMPVYTDGEYTKTYDLWAQDQPNPVAMMEYERLNQWNKNNTLVGNVYLEIQPIENLKIRSSYGINMWFGDSRSWSPPHNLGTLNNVVEDGVSQSMYSGNNWTWTNTISYDYSFGDHSITALVGSEMIKYQKNLSIYGGNSNSKFYDPQYAYLNNTSITDITKVGIGGMDWAAGGGGILSYFTRASYSFKEKYLFTAVVRADGSSNFAEDQRWGTFPSVSAGWIVSNEDFMSNLSFIDFLKVRGSWGQNGNQDIPNFGYSSTMSYYQSAYFFGPDKALRSTSAYPARVPNVNTTWETSEQISIGFDANFLSSKLQATFDWYQKNTKDWLINPPTLSTSGAPGAYINGGAVQNSGVEISLRWRDQIGEFKYGISANVAFNENEVTEINNEDKIFHGPSNVLSQSTSEMFRAEVGHPIGYFWGYETDGIMQNQDEVEAYIIPSNSVTEENGTAGSPYFSDQRPGDLRFVDQNADGIIDDDDKVELGSPLPKSIFGFQVNAEYKGVYAHATLTGQAGMQVMKSYRSFADRFDQNYTTEIFERWHGEGTSDRIPRLTSSSHRNSNYISDIYMHDADFLRISNVTIGYNLRELLSNVKFISGAKIYMSFKNLYTFTSYNGMDPEVGYGPADWSSGIDLGLYPSARTYLIGFNVTF